MHVPEPVSTSLAHEMVPRSLSCVLASWLGRTPKPSSLTEGQSGWVTCSRSLSWWMAERWPEPVQMSFNWSNRDLSRQWSPVVKDLFRHHRQVQLGSSADPDFPDEWTWGNYWSSVSQKVGMVIILFCMDELSLGLVSAWHVESTQSCTQSTVWLLQTQLLLLLPTLLSLPVLLPRRWGRWQTGLDLLCRPGLRTLTLLLFPIQAQEWDSR